MDSNRKKIIFTFDEEYDSSKWQDCKYWANHDRPYLLVLQYHGRVNDVTLKIYADVAYGRIFAQCGKKWHDAQDFLFIPEINTVTFSAYYGDEVAYKPFVLTN